MEPTYRLEGVIRTREEMEDFEGPLNLILMLLAKNKIEIRDIQVSAILDQYLEFLAQMEAMDLEVASEFVQMASHLLYIKTRTLLTAKDEVSELELLMASLEQLKARDVLGAVKEAAPVLGAMAARGSLYIVKPPEPLPTLRDYGYSHKCWELLSALSDVFTRAPTAAEEPERDSFRRRMMPQRIVYSVRDKSIEIIEALRDRGEITLDELYSRSRSRSEVVASFISVLELCSLGSVALRAGENGEIILKYIFGDAKTVLDAGSERPVSEDSET